MPEPTIQQTFELALQRHQAGRLPEAEQLYRQVLARQPEHSGALHNLGVIANQVGQLDIAVDLFRRVIAVSPNLPEAYSNLGSALNGKRQFDQAIAAYNQAIALKPDFAEAHNNLGNALRDTGRIDEAIAAYRQAIALKPNYADAHNNLGNALRDKDQLDEAIVAFRQAIALKPGYAEAHSNLGNALKDKGQLDEAIAAYRQAIALNPNYADALSNLGNALRNSGQLEEAIAACRQSIALKPNVPEAYSNLGNALRDNGQYDEAIAAFRQAIALNPNLPEPFSNLGIAVRDKGQLDDAVAAFRRTIALKPAYAEVHNNLGIALKDMGELDQTIAAYRQTLVLNPDLTDAHSNLVFAMHYHPGYDAGKIAEELRRWNQRHAEPLRKFVQPHSNDPAPDRRLRIGYVSPDLRDHPVGRNLLPLFRHHDHRLFEITCYAQVPRSDAISRQFQQNADRWRNIVGLSDEQAADQIREDKIDILVDLALHTASSRLQLFARKPAPVQATFGGYPGGTGLETIDYRLTDPYLDPPGEADGDYVEKSLRLPSSFWCYDPAAMEAPNQPVNPLPALQNGFITFGCLNNFCKVNDAVLELWAKVMRQLPQSRLILLGPKGSARQRTEAKFQREQIAPERIEWIDRLPREQYLQVYRRIDLGLDTFPYNGHTTSLDSFWMGVPVVTLTGQTVVGRAGRSQLSNLGLPELIAATPEQFIQIAVALANDLPRLSELRQTLRQRMLNSPLCDAEKFACGIESAYRQMWRTWCETSPHRA